jgi:hypothetical protein
MPNDKANRTVRIHGAISIENRCKIILDRKWPQHEIDGWLNMLAPPNDSMPLACCKEIAPRGQN